MLPQNRSLSNVKLWERDVSWSACALHRNYSASIGPDPREEEMTHRPPQVRTFPLWLAHAFAHHYTGRLHWLQHIAARLGRGPALSLWQGALAGYDDEPLQAILAGDWDPVHEAYAQEAEGEIAAVAARPFAVPVSGLTAAEARALVDGMRPFAQLQQRFPGLDLVREITTYEALHLLGDARALVAEAMPDRYGKEGALMVYDAVLEEMAGAGIPALEAEEYLARRLVRFSSAPEEEDMFTAGLDVELVCGSETEVVTRVTHCEWARYYLESHPRMGFLLACAMDNPAYRSFRERLRLQRTCNLMEGGDPCDFRVYGLEEELAG